MEIVFAFLIGGLFAAGFYMMLRRSIVKLIIGLALVANAVNLLIFTAGEIIRGKPPILPEETTDVPRKYADPLAQSLILTSIVINFGVTAFAVVLVHRAYQVLHTDDLDALSMTDL